MTCLARQRACRTFVARKYQRAGRLALTQQGPCRTGRATCRTSRARHSTRVPRSSASERLRTLTQNAHLPLVAEHTIPLAAGDLADHADALECREYPGSRLASRAWFASRSAPRWRPGAAGARNECASPIRRHGQGTQSGTGLPRPASRVGVPCSQHSPTFRERHRRKIPPTLPIHLWRERGRAECITAHAGASDRG